MQFYDYSTSPIDIVNNLGNWISTYRFEPYLKKWFHVRPEMHGNILLVDQKSVPIEVISACTKVEYTEMSAFYAPTKIQIQLNNDCNYRCRICYANNDSLSNKRRISLELLKKLFIEYKNSGILRINFVGGEVFLRSDFKEIVEAAQNNNLLVSCITNGIIPGSNIEKHAKILSQMYMVQVSCNGVENSYNYEHNTNNWLSAWDAIKNVIKAVPSSILSYVITEENVEDIPLFIKYAADAKPTIIKFGTIAWSGKSEKSKSLKYYQEILPKACKYINNERDKYPELKIQSQIDCSKKSPLWEEFLNDYRPFEFYFSPESRDSIYLNSNGDYYPFPLLSGYSKFNVGSCKSDFIELWRHNNILNEIRNVRFCDTSCAEIGCDQPCGLWNRSYAYSWSDSLFSKVPCIKSGWK